MTSLSDPASGRWLLTTISALVIISALVQLGLTATTYAQITNMYIGAWWASVMCILAAISAIVALTRGAVIIACVVSSLAFIAGCIGSIIDGVGSSVVGGMQACVSGPNTKSSAVTYPGRGLSYAGESSSHHMAFDCYFAYLHDGHDCYCVNKGWVSQVKASTAFDVVSTVLVLCLAVTTCASLLCGAGMRRYQPAAAAVAGADGQHAPAHGTAKSKSIEMHIERMKYHNDYDDDDEDGDLAHVDHVVIDEAGGYGAEGGGEEDEER